MQCSEIKCKNVLWTPVVGGRWAVTMEKVLCEVRGKIHEKFGFLLDHFVPLADLVNVGTQDERTDAHRSNNTTQVALGYQQIDPKVPIPPPFCSFTFVPAVSSISILAFSIATHRKALASGVSMTYRTTF